MEETEGTTKDVFGPQSLNTLKVDMHGYLDLEAMDEDSSKGEVRDAYDEELGAEDEHTATVKTIELAHPMLLGTSQMKAWRVHLLAMGYNQMKRVHLQSVPFCEPL